VLVAISRMPLVGLLEYLYWSRSSQRRLRHPIDSSKNRFPFCIVWSPIPIVTWLAPFVGHVGLCDAEGRVVDFTGTIRRDCMAFGWPARYFVVGPAIGVDWEVHLQQLTRRFKRTPYNFLTWNCHSFIASFLNEIAFRRDPLARAYGGWTVAALGLRLFFGGSYVEGGQLRHWGGPVGSWILVVLASLRYGGWLFAAWMRAFMWTNAIFAGWFGVCALWFARSSQFGQRGGGGSLQQGRPRGAAGDNAGAGEASYGESSGGSSGDESEEWMNS